MACQQAKNSDPQTQSLEAASSSKNASEYKILVLGDSLTEGYRLNPRKAFPHLLEVKLREKFKNRELKYTVINAGISGSTSAGALKRFEWQLKAKPQFLILALGANDALRGLDPKNTKANLKAVIQEAQKFEIKILLAGIVSPQNYGRKYKKAFDKIYRELSEEHDLKLFPFLLKDVAGISRLNLSDGIHPNEKGHEVIAQNLFPIVVEML